MSYLIGDRAFYKKVLRISIPIVIQLTVTNFVNLLDNIMVGRVGTEQMSGVSIINQLLFVFNICIFGANAAAGIIGAQYFGKCDYKGVRDTLRMKMLLNGAILVIGISILWFGQSTLINLFLHDGSDVGDIEATYQYAADYLLVILFSLPAFALNSAYTGTLKESGETKIPMMSSIAAVLTNLCLNYVLIFGKFGAPALGVVGAAIATAISRYVELALSAGWTHLHQKNCPYITGIYRSFHIPGELWGKILRMGTPLILNETLWALGMAMINQAYSTRGLVAVAAVNINSTISNLFASSYFAAGNAVGIIVGQLLGAGELERAKREDAQIIAFSVFSCCIVGAVMFLVAPAFPQIYNTYDEVRVLAANLIRICAICLPMGAFYHCTYFTLRCGGKTIITFLFDSGFVCCISLPIAFCLSRFTSLPVAGIYASVMAADLLKCIIGFVLVKKGVWVNKLVG